MGREMRATSVDLSNKIANFGLLGSLLVVGVHVGTSASAGTVTWWFNHVMHDYICAIAVPYFFVCSGFFLAAHWEEPGWYGRELCKRVRSLLVPYVVWCCFSVVLCYAMILLANLQHHRPALANIPCSFEYWLRAFGLYVWDYPNMIHLWFLRALMVLVVASPLLIWACRFFSWAFVPAMFVGVAGLDWQGCSSETHMFLSTVFSLKGVFYFAVGVTFRLKGTMADVLKSRVGGLITIIVALSVLLIPNEILRRHLFVILFLAGGFVLMPSKPMPAALKGISFAIYLIHLPLLMVLGVLCPQMSSTVGGWCLRWGVGWLCAMACALVLRRYPVCTKYLFGGR